MQTANDRFQHSNDILMILIKTIVEHKKPMSLLGQGFDGSAPFTQLLKNHDKLSIKHLRIQSQF